MGDIPEQEEAAMAILEPPSSCLTLRVFYLRLSRCAVDESMLDALTVSLIPLTPDTVLEVSGDKQASIISNDKRGVSCPLRPDRFDAKAEEATFVSTATVRIVSGGVLFGDVKAATEKSGGGKRRSWVMKCQEATQRGSGFLRRGSRETNKAPPAVEVYVAGVVRGTPVVFTKAMQLRFRRRRQVKAFMDTIPECAELPEPEQAEEATAHQEHDTEESEYRCYKPDPAADDDGLYYTGSAGRDDDYSELSWFSAGVRVGVGISLGICLGVGVGAGLLARSYQSTSKTLTRRLISKLL